MRSSVCHYFSEKYVQYVNHSSMGASSSRSLMFSLSWITRCTMMGNEMEMEKGERRKRERGEDILRSFICTIVLYLASLPSSPLLSSPLESLLMTHLLLCL